jgi:hypothetical protein
MKKILFLTSLLFIAAFFSQSVKAQTEAQKIELCTKVAGGDATLEQSYPVQLPAAIGGERAPNFKKAVAMRKSNRYRFTICTDEESSGEAILELFDEAKKVGSSYIPETGKTYQSFDFDCTKSAVYVIFVSFKDGKEGSAIGILSHIKTL